MFEMSVHLLLASSVLKGYEFFYFQGHIGLISSFLFLDHLLGEYVLHLRTLYVTVELFYLSQTDGSVDSVHISSKAATDLFA